MYYPKASASGSSAEIRRLVCDCEAPRVFGDARNSWAFVGILHEAEGS